MTAAGLRCHTAMFSASKTSSVAEMGRHCPADHSATPRIEHYRQVQKASSTWNGVDYTFKEQSKRLAT